MQWLQRCQFRSTLIASHPPPYIFPPHAKFHGSPFILLCPMRKPTPLEKLDPDCSRYLHVCGTRSQEPIPSLGAPPGEVLQEEVGV